MWNSSNNLKIGNCPQLASNPHYARSHPARVGIPNEEDDDDDNDGIPDAEDDDDDNDGIKDDEDIDDDNDGIPDDKEGQPITNDLDGDGTELLWNEI